MSEFLNLHALADGELSGNAKREAEELLQTSPEANAEYQSILNLKQTLAEKVEPIFDEDVWKASVRRLDEIDKRKRAENFVGKYAWGMCAIIFSLIISAGMMNRYNGRSVAASEVANVAATMAPFSQNMPNRQPQDMKSWIQDVSRGAPVHVEARDLQVVRYWQGAREDQFMSVFYCIDSHGPITLVIVKGANQVTGLDPAEGQGRYFVGEIDRANSLSWIDRDFAMTLIGDRPHDQLALVADGIALR